MPRLVNWWLVKANKLGGEERIMAKGNVYNSEKFATGAFITTSRIKEIRMTEEERIEIQTRNSLYSCYWKDCDFDMGETSECIKGFEYYRERFEKKLQVDIPSDSVLLVLTEKSSECCKNALYKRGESSAVSFKGNIYGFAGSLSKVIQGYGDGQREEIDIRMNCIGNGVSLYYASLPEDTGLFAVNHGEVELRIRTKRKQFKLQPGELLEICSNGEQVREEVTNYRELNRQCILSASPLPTNHGIFAQEKVLKQISRDVINGKLQEDYLIMTEALDMKGEAFTMAVAADGISMAILCKQYDLLQSLLETGVIPEKISPIWVQAVKEREHCFYWRRIELFEFLCICEDMPQETYHHMWQRIREKGIWEQKEPLRPELLYEDKSILFIQCIKRLEQEWSVAAEEFMKVVIADFMESYDATNESWKGLYEAFPDKRDWIFKCMCSLQKRESNYGHRRYFPENDGRSLLAHWRQYKCYVEAAQAVEMAITVLGMILENKTDFLREEETALALLDSINQAGFQGDAFRKERDECMWKILKFHVHNEGIWESLFRGEFIPVEEVDGYIIYLQEGGNAGVGLIPGLIRRKYRRKVEEE